MGTKVRFQRTLSLSPAASEALDVLTASTCRRGQLVSSLLMKEFGAAAGAGALCGTARRPGRRGPGATGGRKGDRPGECKGCPPPADARPAEGLAGLVRRTPYCQAWCQGIG
jgi:hypothetical protein